MATLLHVLSRWAAAPNEDITVMQKDKEGESTKKFSNFVRKLANFSLPQDIEHRENLYYSI